MGFEFKGLSKRMYLQELCNSLGDFKVAKTSINKDGSLFWGKHRSVMECWSDDRLINYLDEVSHRTIFPGEIVLDYDDNPTLEKLNEICDKLDSYGAVYCAFSTGSRGYHIHIFEKDLVGFSKLNRSEFKRNIIESLGGELLKSSENVMIALEFTPHWKSGKNKSPVRSHPNGWWFI